MEYIETCRILGEHGATRVWHWLSWSWHCRAFYNGCDPNGGVACQEGHNLPVPSCETQTKDRDAAQDDVCHYTLRNLEAMLLKRVWNARSCHLHRERCNTCSRRWHCVSRWEPVVSAKVLRSAPLGLFASAHPAASEKYCSSWLESAGE